MATLYNGDCFDSMELMDNNSVDLIFCDLPYGQTSCKWDCLIDLDKLWIEFMRIKKLNTPIIMTCTTKFGLSLLNSCPKKCPFRYDLVWCKSASAGFLCAKKMPMRKHEMIYVFYEKLPFYDLSSHTHKFVKETPTKRPGKDGVDNKGMIKNRSKSGMETQNKYDPPLPNSLIKDEEFKIDISKDGAYGNNLNIINPKHRKDKYKSPLPTSLIKEDGCYGDAGVSGSGTYKGEYNINNNITTNEGSQRYDPPLPNSLIKEDGCYGDAGVSGSGTYKGEYNINNNITTNEGSQRYDPPLPNSLIKEDCPEPEPEPDNIIKDTKYGTNTYNTEKRKTPLTRMSNEVVYEPALPNSLLEIKSTRGKHSTEKPVALMEWILKYYSKEDDIVFDPTMGSGSMGVACGNMNRNFIGIEKDAEIYEVAVNRIEE
tara:strand:+ start:573 stop:1853 length:1281 start_codon:yes stop_codon:yes gene_type:complete